MTHRLKSRWCLRWLSFWTTWGHQMWYVEVFESFKSYINLLKNLLSIYFANCIFVFCKKVDWNTIRNHVIRPLCSTPIWLWVVYHNGKPLIASMSGYNPLHAHYGCFVVVDNNGPIILFFFPISVAQLSLGTVKPLLSHLTRSPKWFSLMVKNLYIY